MSNISFIKEETRSVSGFTQAQPAFINVGLIGHVSNGKTTLVKCLTNIDTKKDSREKKRGMTIKLGYANAIVWYCEECKINYCTAQETTQKFCEECFGECEVEFNLSFCDMPGHHSYVSTMIKGASLISCAILVVDARKKTLQPQTIEHLIILESLGIQNVIIAQNKVDLITKEECLQHYAQIKEELKGTIGENAPIIPISAQLNIQIEKIIEYLGRMCRLVNREEKGDQGSFMIVRSFDINRPNTDVAKLKGGVIGGTVFGNGSYQVGDRLEIKPGIIQRDGKCVSLYTKVLSLRSEKKSVKSIQRGGLFAIGTNLDPTATKGDRLAGCIAGKEGELPEVVNSLKIKMFHLKHTVLGEKVSKLKMKKGRYFKLIIGNIVRDACCEGYENHVASLRLQHPICTYLNKCLVYHVKGMQAQLIGYGEIIN